MVLRNTLSFPNRLLHYHLNNVPNRDSANNSMYYLISKRLVYAPNGELSRYE